MNNPLTAPLQIRPVAPLGARDVAEAAAAGAPIFIFDLDNCISDDAWRMPLIRWEAEDVNERYAAYHQACGGDAFAHSPVLRDALERGIVFFLTARPFSAAAATRHWLARVFAALDPAQVRHVLLMRPDNDHRPSVGVKRAMLNEMLHPNIYGIPDVRNIHGAYDDRQDIVDMYRDAGIKGASLLRIHDVCAMTPPAPPSPASTDPVAQRLLAAAATREARSAVYGDGARQFGAVAAALFPDGLRIQAPEEWARLGVVVQLASKLMRYSRNFPTGGHADSAHDAMVYAAMLAELGE